MILAVTDRAQIILHRLIVSTYTQNTSISRVYLIIVPREVYYASLMQVTDIGRYNDRDDGPYKLLLYKSLRNQDYTREGKCKHYLSNNAPILRQYFSAQ